MNASTPPCGRILLATLMPTAASLPSSTAVASTTAEPFNIQDDHRGAMLFVVATVCVYGLSIVAFIAGHLQKGLINKDEERQISHYIKRMHTTEPCTVDRNFYVTRFKSSLLASSALGQRHNRRISMMNKQSVSSYPPGLAMSRRTRAGHGGEDLEVVFADDDFGDRSGQAPLLNKDNVQIVCEQPLFPQSGRMFAPRRQRRSGLVGIADQEPGFDGNTVGCWRRTAAGETVERLRVHKPALHNIEEDEASEDDEQSEDSVESRLSSDDQRKTSDNSQSESPLINERRASSRGQSRDSAQGSSDSPLADQPVDFPEASRSDQTPPVFYVSEATGVDDDGDVNDDDLGDDDDEFDESESECEPRERDIEARRESWQDQPPY